MDELIWSSGDDPAPMVAWLTSSHFTPRKRRLFACACLRQVWDELAHPESRRAVEMAEWAVDRVAPDVEKYQLEALEVSYAAGPARARLYAWAASRCLGPDWGVLDAWRTLYRHADRAGRAGQAASLRCLGNPFRPPSSKREWASREAVSLAWAAYEDRDFALLPLLADALVDAGCDDGSVLGHLRTGPHVKGCWAVDLILGKS